MNAPLNHPYLDQPVEVSIETLALCNARCTFCPYPTLTRKGVEMPEALMYKLLAQMADFSYPFTFSPFKVNEPFLDHRLMGFLDHTRLIPNMTLRLFTNGSPLTREIIDQIASFPQVAHLWISLNSCVVEEYQQIMGLRFDNTARKLDMLHKQVAKKDFPHTVIVSKVVATVNRDNDFKYYCLNRWPLFTSTLIKQDSWLGYVAPMNPEVPKTPCSRWFELSILSTGIVSLCCMDGKGDFPIGDVNKNTLLEVYNSDHYRQRRLSMMSRTQIHPCNTCSY